MEIEIAALSEILRDGMAVLMKSGHSITRHEPTLGLSGQGAGGFDSAGLISTRAWSFWRKRPYMVIDG